VSNSTAATAPVILWRVRISDRSDLVFALRDYFRRLGMAAEVESPTLVEVTTDHAPEKIEEYVAEWARINAAPLHIEKLSDEPQRLFPVPPPSGSPRLGTLLVGKGYITEEQLTRALVEARATNDLLGVVLLREKLIFEEELARTLSEQMALPYISIMRVGINANVSRMLPADVGEAAAAIPVRTIGDAVQVAFADPTDPTALGLVGRHLPNVVMAVAELTDIRLAWRGIAEPNGTARSSLNV
jgi:hypothetical protein